MQNYVFFPCMLFALSTVQITMVKCLRHHLKTLNSSIEPIYAVELARKYVLIQNIVDSTRKYRCLHDRIKSPKIYAISIISIA